MLISTNSAPRSFRIFRLARHAALAAASPKNFWSAGRGMPMTQRGGTAPRRPSAIGRENGSPSSLPAMTSYTAQASSTVPANTETQSSVLQAGTTPLVDTAPTEGLRPTILLRPAGTRPEPAVSVPSANGTRPSATAMAEPELDPPGTMAGSKVFLGTG